MLPDHGRAERDDFGVVIAAAGHGSRFGARKQFLELDGRPLVYYSLDVFSGLSGVASVVVVAPGADLAATDQLVDSWRAEAADRCRLPRDGADLQIRAVAGGERRQDSVRKGIEALGESVEWVLVHDAARPLIRPDDARRVLEAVRAHGAAAVGYPVTDSVKEERDGWAARGLDRDHIWQVQTPQGARIRDLRRAYDLLPPGKTTTDEVALLEVVGVKACLVRGSIDNLKVTHPGDEKLAAFFLERRRAGRGAAGAFPS